MVNRLSNVGHGQQYLLTSRMSRIQSACTHVSVSSKTPGYVVSKEAEFCRIDLVPKR
jgi:hypothetical protein